ncbi:MAG TPA: T9SS type A sorting domain-containing protein [Bacteroidia bacterium]
MKKLLFTICFLSLGLLKAQTPYVAIPDSNFVHYLKTIVPTAFKGDSLNTSSTLVTTYTQTMNVQGLSIANLTGIQYFTSLTSLYCNSNSLTSLPALPNSITDLYCQNNSLTSLPTLPNSLTSLVCENNNLTTLPALPNSLMYFYCYSNSLTSLPALPNSLSYLACGTNSLTSLPALPNSLINLFCYSNSLTSLPALPNSLQRLSCEYNSLTTLPTLPNSLTQLVCYANSISCFPTFPNSISTSPGLFSIDPNPYNCLPNYIAAMTAANSTSGVSDSVTYPNCAAGNSNGCAVAGIEQYNINNEVNIYPNPASTSLTLTLSYREGTTSVEIYNTIGERVYSSPAGGGKEGAWTINVTDLTEGVYNISITSNEGVINKRLVIVR